MQPVPVEVSRKETFLPMQSMTSTCPQKIALTLPTSHTQRDAKDFIDALRSDCRDACGNDNVAGSLLSSPCASGSALVCLRGSPEGSSGLTLGLSLSLSPSLSLPLSLKKVAFASAPSRDLLDVAPSPPRVPTFL